MVEAVVGRPAPRAHDVGGVILSSKEPAPIEVEHLPRRMGRDIIREGDPKSSPNLLALRPRLDLAHFESRPSKQERHGHVVPEGVADEVQDVEVVPPDALP